MKCELLSLVQYNNTYYFKENELIYYRYQTWLRTTTPREAKEFLELELISQEEYDKLKENVKSDGL